MCVSVLATLANQNHIHGSWFVAAQPVCLGVSVCVCVSVCCCVCASLWLCVNCDATTGFTGAQSAWELERLVVQHGGTVRFVRGLF